MKRKLRKLFQKIPNKLLNAILLVLICLALISFFGIETMKKFELWGMADIANTIENFCAPILFVFDKLVIKIRICVFLTVSAFVRICKTAMRPIAIMIGHTTFSNNQSTYDKTIVEGYKVEDKNINLVDQMNGQEVSGAICAQDNIVKEILNSCDEFTELFYYGIAHIPLIFRAGFQIGDEGCVRLLHKYRNGQSKFKEISREPDDYSFQLKGKPEYGNAESTEMLVTIATSLPVMSEDLSVFREMDLNCELQFKAEKKEMYGFDVINSYATMNRLRTGILNQIRKTAISRKISRIHLVLATSSDFAFFLAQGFSTYHDPEVVTYQYERSSVEKYPWGISNKLPPDDAVVCQTTHPCANE